MKKKNLISDVLKNSHLNFKKIINNSDCIVSIKKLTPIRNFKLILIITY